MIWVIELDSLEDIETFVKELILFILTQFRLISTYFVVWLKAETKSLRESSNIDIITLDYN